MRSKVPGMWAQPALALATLAALIPGAALRAESRAPNPAEARLKNDVAYLADDEREGRGPGTKGIESAAEYIAAAFRDAGLKPAPGAQGYFQPFSLGGNPVLGATQEMALSGPEDEHLKAELKKDFTPLAIGTGGT